MEKKLHVYVAGPFRAATPWLIEQNVRRAEEAALEVWRMGAVAVVPHMLTRHFQDSLPDSVWIEGLMSLMSVCDMMLVLPGWKNSEGTKSEITEAQRQKKRIFYTLKELSQWLVEDTEHFKKWMAEEGAPTEHACSRSCAFMGCEGETERRQDPPQSTTMNTRRSTDDPSLCPDCGGLFHLRHCPHFNRLDPY
jgi:hypothetical protein